MKPYTLAEVEHRQNIGVSTTLEHWARVRATAAALEASNLDRVQLREALEGLIEIGKRDLTNPKYDGYFEFARDVLAEVAPVVAPVDDGKNHMIYAGGSKLSFHCPGDEEGRSCGCNVFRRLDETPRYKCNACGSIFRAEVAP